MDIHKPKPWHGVREFLKEYVIIVVGVLTALGAEQGVEWLHWRHEVRVADAALRAELRTDGVATLRVLASWPCAQWRMDQLSHDLRTTTGRWKGQGFLLEGRKAVLVIPAQPWFSAAWEEYRSNGAVQHMPGDMRAMFNSLYIYVDGEDGWGREYGPASAELAILADDLPLSDVTGDRELAAIEKARFAEYFAARAGRNFLTKLNAAGITFTAAETHPHINACNPQYGGPPPLSPPALAP